MKRYIDFMKRISPSRTFISSLEYQMNDIIAKKQKKRNSRRLVCTAAIFSTICIAIICVAFSYTSVHKDNISSINVAGEKATIIPNLLSTITPSSEETRIPLIESEEGVPFPETDISYTYGVLIAGVDLNQSAPIYASADKSSAVLVTLNLGDCCWISDTAKENGMAQVSYWVSEKKQLIHGWTQRLENVETLPADYQSTFLYIPGRVVEDNCYLRYGRNMSAPYSGVLEKGQLLFLVTRIDNWVLASTAPFLCPTDDIDAAYTGWIPINEVIAMHWITSEEVSNNK